MIGAHLLAVGIAVAVAQGGLPAPVFAGQWRALTLKFPPSFKTSDISVGASEHGVHCPGNGHEKSEMRFPISLFLSAPLTGEQGD
ncbi:hypothetical protein GCM10007053_26510 [Halioglobus pacificus]|uniref:Uncharacterized protein n=1 Tax=Parahalioglobus pacificus TaxID=930806 RepID=A0A918XM25_9GAMM|nr:hypothetical protein GCM10007053_26510 [Halioglobus pacificus]